MAPARASPSRSRRHGRAIVSPAALGLIERLHDGFLTRSAASSSAGRTSASASSTRAHGRPSSPRTAPARGLEGGVRAARPPRPPLRDHRAARPQDDDQRSQLRRARVHVRLRGRLLADLDERGSGPVEPPRRGEPHDLAGDAREAVRAERRDRDPRRASTRVAPRRASRRTPRDGGLRLALRLRACVLPQRGGLLERGSGPYFYLPKLESRDEAALWARAFAIAEDALGVPAGSVRCTVLIETIPAAFEMDAILWELRDYGCARNAGRWGLHLQRDQEVRRGPSATGLR